MPRRKVTYGEDGTTKNKTNASIKDYSMLDVHNLHAFSLVTSRASFIFPARLLLENTNEGKKKLSNLHLHPLTYGGCPFPCLFPNHEQAKVNEPFYFLLYLLELMHCTCGEEGWASYLAMTEEYYRFHIIQHQSLLASQELPTLIKRNMYLQSHTSSLLHNTFFCFSSALALTPSLPTRTMVVKLYRTQQQQKVLRSCER